MRASESAINNVLEQKYGTKAHREAAKCNVWLETAEEMVPFASFTLFADTIHAYILSAFLSYTLRVAFCTLNCARNREVCAPIVGVSQKEKADEIQPIPTTRAYYPASTAL